MTRLLGMGLYAANRSRCRADCGFRREVWPVLQDLGQLKALYEARWETFLGNAGVLQFFGNNDLTTLEWISKRCGRTAVRVRTDKPLSVDQIDAGLTGEHWTTEIHDLLGLDEAARYFARDDVNCPATDPTGGQDTKVHFMPLSCEQIGNA